MTFKSNVEIAKGRIDIAPMVNIVFLLLIFFVLTSPLVLQPGLGSVALPPGPATSASLQELIVTISRNNLIFINQKQTTLEQLPDELRRAARDTRNPELILKADRQVSYDMIVKIISIALDSGISAVNMATRPEPVTPSK